MTKKEKRSFTEIKEYCIYVIMDTYRKQFYIGSTPKNRLNAEYWEHYAGRRASTRKLFEAAKESGVDPKMYFITSLEATKNKANNIIIPYVKFFISKGYQCLNSSTLISFTDQLEPENEKLFQYLIQFEVDSLCNEETDLFPNYSEKKKKRAASVPEKITINLTPEDYKRIEEKASENDMNVHKFCKQMILYDARLLQVDFSILNESIDVLREIEETLKQIMYTIYKSENYYPEDLEMMQSFIDEVKKSESAILKQILEETQTIKQIMK